MKSDLNISNKSKGVRLLVNGIPTDEEGFKAAFRRHGELFKLRELMLVKRPHNNGERSFSKRDERSYYEAWSYAQGFDSIFLKSVSSAAKAADVRFFEVTTQAMRDVREARGMKVSCTIGHMVAAIQAKLELEQSLGCLPTQKQVKDRAFFLVMYLWKDQDFSPYESKHKAWSKIFKAAGLDYLPRAVRGKGDKK